MKTKRIHLFEWEDFPWFPAVIRNLVTDYLHFVVTTFHPFKAAVHLLKNALKELNCHRIIDIGSGAAGPLKKIQQDLAKNFDYPVTMVLLDKYPNCQAFENFSRTSPYPVEYIAHPVDARHLPEDLLGFHTFFTTFHHFRPADARQILLQITRRRQGIGIFETTGRDVLTMLLILLSPLYVLLFTPFIRPFTFTRVFWTYLIPLVPLIAVWDGLVSNLRTYSPEELQELVQTLPDSGYRWQFGRISSLPGIKLTYLIGIPESGTADGQSKTAAGKIRYSR